MPSLTASHPFGLEAHESVPAIFLRILLHCGVLAGVGLAVMLWGVSEPAVAIGTLLVLSAAVSFGICRAYPRWTMRRCVLLAARIGCSVAAAAAVVQVAGGAGALLVTLCVVISPGALSAVREAGRWLLRARRSTVGRR